MTTYIINEGTEVQTRCYAGLLRVCTTRLSCNKTLIFIYQKTMQMIKLATHRDLELWMLHIDPVLSCPATITAVTIAY